MFINFMAMSGLKNSDTYLSPKIPLIYKPLRKKRINYASSHIDYIMENTTDN